MKGEIAMKIGEDYVEVAQVNQMEFGMLYHEERDPVLEMNVIHEERMLVRTIGYARDIETAYEVVERCIKQRFNEKGLTFAPSPSYCLNPLPELLVI